MAGEFSEAVTLLNESLVDEGRTKHIADLTLRVIHEAYGSIKQRTDQPMPPRKSVLRGIGGKVCKAIKNKFGAAAVYGIYAKGPNTGDIRGKMGGGVTVLNSDPLVATIDDWLTPEEASYLPKVVESADEAIRTQVPPRSQPYSKEHPKPEKESDLCLTARRRLELQKIVKQLVDNHANAPPGALGLCDATAALKDADPFPFDGNGRVCAPITKGLDDALVGSDSIMVDVGSDEAVDVLDAAMSRAVGFEDEYDAYDFSTHAQITSYRPKKGFATHIDCHDFAYAAKTERTVTAILYVTQTGATRFPALNNITVAGVPGRLLLFENLLPDGTCDPSTAHVSDPIVDGERKVILQKWFHTDRSFDRQQSNAEGMKERPTGYTECDLNDCRRYERLPPSDLGKTIDRLRMNRKIRTTGDYRTKNPYIICDYPEQWSTNHAEVKAQAEAAEAAAQENDSKTQPL
mmetsp:Transcript_5146/g.16178  ORF Transcript_5146/g.16178 Transcript_5146/m.16178 type:complete len:461 (+) Transcript_5146:982-2364(+)